MATKQSERTFRSVEEILQAYLPQLCETEPAPRPVEPKEEGLELAKESIRRVKTQLALGR